MPPMLRERPQAQDVAAYVAAVAAKPVQDAGALATAMAETVVATAANGKAIFTRRRRVRVLSHAALRLRTTEQSKPI